MLQAIDLSKQYGNVNALKALNLQVEPGHIYCLLGANGAGTDELSHFLEEVGLQSSAFKQRVKGYSKGMQQKVGIAIAIAKKAKALLLDEPTSGLDPKASNEFSELLVKLSSQ